MIVICRFYISVNFCIIELTESASLIMLAKERAKNFFKFSMARQGLLNSQAIEVTNKLQTYLCDRIIKQHVYRHFIFPAQSRLKLLIPAPVYPWSLRMELFSANCNKDLSRIVTPAHLVSTDAHPNFLFKIICALHIIFVAPIETFQKIYLAFYGQDFFFFINF